MAETTEMTMEEALALEPVSEFARRIGKTKNTLLAWRKDGRWNVSRTKLVRLGLKWMPCGGWGCTDEIYRQFIEDLQEE